MEGPLVAVQWPCVWDWLVGCHLLGLPSLGSAGPTWVPSRCLETPQCASTWGSSQLASIAQGLLPRQRQTTLTQSASFAAFVHVTACLRGGGEGSWSLSLHTDWK